MAEDNRSGIVFKAVFQHFAWVYFGAVQAAGEEFFISEQLVLIVQEHASKDLVRQ